MSIRFDKMAEQQIRKAQAEGQFNNLPGAGKPLNADKGGSTSLSSGYKIMAEAGVLPKEFELRKLIDAQRKSLKGITDPDHIKAINKGLADLELRLAIEQDARRRFMRTSR